jgi:hypothetical protein
LQGEMQAFATLQTAKRKLEWVPYAR